MSASSIVPVINPVGAGYVTISLVASGRSDHYTYEDYEVEAHPNAGYTLDRMEYTYTYEDLWNGGTTSESSSSGSSFSFREYHNTDTYYHYGNDTLTSVTAYFKLLSYYITAFANTGGSTTGSGRYDYGTSCTVVATPNSGYVFTGWYEDGSIVSSNASYTFTVTSQHYLTATFEPDTPTTYIITTTVSPAGSGTTAGGGTYTSGATANLTATSSSGYMFLRWELNGVTASTSAAFSVTVTGNATYTAVFRRFTNLLVNSATYVSPVRLVYDPSTNLLVADY